MKKKKVFKCELLTPMFGGSALPGKCELRPPAIKGALRFWWRAMHGNLGLKEMRVKEEALFGTVRGKAGKSKVSVHVRHDLKELKPEEYLQQYRAMFASPSLKYLAYGPCENGEYSSNAFVNGTFLLEIGYDEDLNMQPVWDALAALVNYGGLGSRTRNGWGKIRISAWPEGVVPKMRINSTADQTSYSAFSRNAVVLHSEDEFPNSAGAMQYLSKIYKEYRYGQDEENQYKNRLLIARPISQAPKDRVLPDRHAKSVFLGIAPLDNNAFKAQLLILPYNYLANSERALPIKDHQARAQRRKKAKMLQSPYQNVLAELVEHLEIDHNFSNSTP